MCLTQNIDLKQSIKLEHDFSNFMETDYQNASSMMNGGNRNEESTFVLLTDIFENVNLYDVRQTRYIWCQFVSSSYSIPGNLSKIHRQ